MATNDPLLSTTQASEFLGVATQSLAAARCTRVGSLARIPYVKMSRLVKYRLSDLEAYAAACRVVPVEA